MTTARPAGDFSKSLNLAGTAVRASSLGCILGFSLCLAITRHAHRPELPLYIASLSLFHILEFWTTAAYNERNVTNQSFLLSSNGMAYWLAQLAGILEYACEARLDTFWYTSKTFHHSTLLTGLCLVILGQTIRSLAMIQAAENFSHALAYSKKPQHVLVTTGLYS